MHIRALFAHRAYIKNLVKWWLSPAARGRGPPRCRDTMATNSKKRPLPMKTDDLRAFDAVVRYGSISEAARSMDLTQSAITRRIQNLEEALGAQLLDRSTKPPHPSLLGLRVYQQTKTVLREIDALAGLVAP